MPNKKILFSFIVVAFVLASICIYLFYQNRTILYKKNLFYMDTMIQIKIYSNNKAKATEALKTIDEIYSDYHKLSDRYNSYNNIHNVYFINNNNLDDEYITIDERLYDLLDFGLQWYEKSNHLLDINMGCVIEKWKDHFDTADGIPSNDELNSCTVNQIVLGEDYTILNNKPNIDLGAIAKGYATQIASDYLESIGLTKYLINAGGNIIVGDHYDNESYKVGIENPNDKTIYKILNITNKAVVTSGGYERFYEFNGHKYSHIISPITKYPAEYMKSVTVIADNSALADAETTTLFLLPIENNKKKVENMDVEVIWYSNNDEIITTDGVSAYE